MLVRGERLGQHGLLSLEPPLLAGGAQGAVERAMAPALLAQRGRVGSHYEVPAVILGSQPGLEPLAWELTRADRVRDCAAGLAGVAAVGETAGLGELLDITERALGRQAHVARKHSAQPGGVDQDAATREHVQFAVCRGVP